MEDNITIVRLLLDEGTKSAINCLRSTSIASGISNKQEGHLEKQYYNSAFTTGYEGTNSAINCWRSTSIASGISNKTIRAFGRQNYNSAFTLFP